MRTNKLIHIVSCHAEGEVGDVIVGGVAPPPGDSVWAQSRWIADDQQLRQLLLQEPRGGVFRHVNLLVPPKDPRAAMGWIIMEPEDTPPMSGSNAICVATVLLDSGILPMQEPCTQFHLEAPGGLIGITAACRDGKAESIAVENVPSFAALQQAPLDVVGLPPLRVDTAFGGDSFVIVQAADLGFSLHPDEAEKLAITGIQITNAANQQLTFQHPGNPDWHHFSFCLFIDEDHLQDGVHSARHAVAIQPGKIDRSPTGTAVSARMALLHAQGRLAVGAPYVATSLIDSQFHGRIKGTTTLGDTAAVIPEVRGRAWITGTHQIMVDPQDPWPTGYRLGDTWPNRSNNVQNS